MFELYFPGPRFEKIIQKTTNLIVCLVISKDVFKVLDKISMASTFAARWTLTEEN